jgi:hypothetical protein
LWPVGLGPTPPPTRSQEDDPVETTLIVLGIIIGAVLCLCVVAVFIVVIVIAIGASQRGKTTTKKTKTTKKKTKTRIKTKMATKQQDESFDASGIELQGGTAGVPRAHSSINPIRGAWWRASTNALMEIKKSSTPKPKLKQESSRLPRDVTGISSGTQWVPHQIVRDHAKRASL